MQRACWSRLVISCLTPTQLNGLEGTMASSVRMKSNKQDRIKRDTSGACNNMGARDGVVEDWDEGASSVPVYASSHNTPHAAIATKETKDVLRLRLVVFFVLITFTIAVATSVYLHLHWNEESKFREHFHDDADKILQAVGSTLDNILGSFDSLAVSSISLARATNQSWPFVTLPHFAVRMSKLVPLSRSVVTFLSPIVQPKQRQAWEAYSVQNDDWLYESIELQREFKHYYGSYENHTLDLGKLHGDFGEIPQNERYETVVVVARLSLGMFLYMHACSKPLITVLCSRIFLPTWQNFPVVPNVRRESLRVHSNLSCRALYSSTHHLLVVNTTTVALCLQLGLVDHELFVGAPDEH
jgi:hypothetical protein